MHWDLSLPCLRPSKLPKESDINKEREYLSLLYLIDISGVEEAYMRDSLSIPIRSAHSYPTQAILIRELLI